LAQLGDSDVLMLISDSAGVESQGYTPSEKAVYGTLDNNLSAAPGRAIVVLPGTNTHRLQILFDLAAKRGRKVVLYGETLIKTAVVAVVTGNLTYDRRIEASLEELPQLPDQEVLIIATGLESDPMDILKELAHGRNRDLTPKHGEPIIFIAEPPPGTSRQLAMFLDQFLSIGVKTIYGARSGVYVSKHASREELKLIMAIVKPRY